MKIRNDFVTNSSSSSFILGFNNEEDIRKLKSVISSYLTSDCFEDNKDNYANEVISNIERGITTKENAIELYEDSLYGLEYLYEYDNKRHWQLSEEKINSKEYLKFFEDLKSGLRKEFIDKLNLSNVISIVSYSDHDLLGSELEHEIMPYLDNTIETINNH